MRACVCASMCLYVSVSVCVCVRGLGEQTARRKAPHEALFPREWPPFMSGRAGRGAPDKCYGAVGRPSRGGSSSCTLRGAEAGPDQVIRRAKRSEEEEQKEGAGTRLDQIITRSKEEEKRPGAGTRLDQVIKRGRRSEEEEE